MPNYASKKPGSKANIKTPGVRALERAVERLGSESGATSKPAPRKDRPDAQMKKLLSEFDRRLNELRRLTRPEHRPAGKPASKPSIGSRQPVRSYAASATSRGIRKPASEEPAAERNVRAPLPAAPVRGLKVSERELPNVTRADREAVRHLQESGGSLRPRVPHAVKAAEARRAESYIGTPEPTRRVPDVPSAVSRRAEYQTAEARSERSSAVRASSSPRRAAAASAEAASHRALGPVAAAATNRHELALRNMEKSRRETERHVAPPHSVRADRAKPPEREARYSGKLRADGRSERVARGSAEIVSHRAAAVRAEHDSRREAAAVAAGRSERAPAAVEKAREEPARERPTRESPSRRRRDDERQELARALSTNETPHLSHAITVEGEKLQRDKRLQETSSAARGTDRMLSERLVERERHAASAPSPEFQSRSLGKTTSPAVARAAKETESGGRKNGGSGGGGRRELTGKLTITSSNGQRLGKADLQLDMG